MRKFRPSTIDFTHTRDDGEKEKRHQVTKGDMRRILRKLPPLSWRKLRLFWTLLNVVARHAGSPVPFDRPSADQTKHERLENNIAHVRDAIELGDYRRDLFVASLPNEDPDEFLAALIRGAEVEYRQWLARMAEDLRSLHGHAAKAAKMANDQKETSNPNERRLPGPDEREITILVELLTLAIGITTGRKPPTDYAEGDYGKCLKKCGEVFGVPEDKRKTRSMLVDRYRRSHRRQHIDGLIDSPGELVALVTRMRVGDEKAKARILEIMLSGLPLDFSQVNVKESSKSSRAISSPDKSPSS